MVHQTQESASAGVTESVSIAIPGVGTWILSFVDGIYTGYMFMPTPP
jgi:hypothetical protein